MAALKYSNTDSLELFGKKFDKDSFQKFISDLFGNSIKQNKNISHEEDWIKECDKLYEDNEKVVLSIETLKSIEQSRSYHKNFIRKFLNNQNYALVAFHHKNSDEWRLSFVEKVYESSQGKIKEKYTHYKRSSFLVGDKVGTHTIQSRLKPVIDSNKFKMENLKEAFNIETVSDEFFKEYKNLYSNIKEKIDLQISSDNNLKDHLKMKSIKSKDLAKHLLGQIVFLYFIQKKGWFGVKKDKQWGSGDKDFLRQAFNKEYGKYQNFFNNILEPLFYEILSKKRKDDYCEEFKCRIPFLNGGLFEPYKNYNYKKFKLNFSDDLFLNKNMNEYDDKGTGILDVFDRYNFTVKEDEPLEKEVAIDPEMLGRVFESLIPDNERKSKGAFYTPREIVHYMCQESLIYCIFSEFEEKIKKEDVEQFVRHEYQSITKEKLPENIQKYKQSIDKFLKEITICDPAVGSGAFPVAMMLEIIKLRELLNKSLDVYKAKLACIKKSLYGVDIDEGSVEVAKLRLWLSLVVDEGKTRLIRPLPNLEYKVMSGNSLLEEKESLFNDAINNKLEKKKTDFFKEIDVDKKKKLRETINNEFKKITGSSPKENILFKKFTFSIYFSEIMKKGGFDIVITNPPYIRHEELEKLGYKSPLEAQMFQIFGSSMDLYGYFYEQAFNLLKEKRVSTFITSNKWLRTTYGKNLRKFFEKKTKINNIIDFKGNKIFSSATVDTNILTFQKQAVGDEYSIPYADFSNLNINKIMPIHNQIKIQSYRPEGEGEPWLLLNEIEQRIKDKIEEKGILLEKWNIKIRRGILTGCNEAFIIDSETKNRLCKEHPSSKKIIKPVLKGEDIKNWHYKQKEYLINTHNSCQNLESINVKKDYPAIWNHLRKINQKMNGKVKIRCDKGDHWANLRSCSYLKEFEKEKIIYPEINGIHKFTYDKNGMYILNSAYILTCENKSILKSILGQLNSSLSTFLIQLKNIKLSETSRLLSSNMRRIYFLPPKPFSNTNYPKYVDEIVELTTSVDYSKNDIKKQKVKKLQSKIDQILFDLYGLTQEEQKYILDKVK